MSRKSNDWAWKQNLKPTLKILLLSMADRTNEVHECFPSHKRLVEDTGLNIKTVQKNIKILESMGLIHDTGKRKGKLLRVKVWKFTFINEKDVINPKTGVLEKDPINPKTGSLKHPKTGCLNQPKNGCMNHPALEPPNRTTQRDTALNKQPKKQTEPKSKQTWIAYANAYRNRYGHEPVRSAKVNSLLCNFVDQVGKEDAPMIAEYYLYLNDSWYQKKYHDVATLLQNAQAIRTQWLNQTNLTGQDFRMSEKTSSRLNTHNEVLRAIRDGEI